MHSWAALQGQRGWQGFSLTGRLGGTGPLGWTGPGLVRSGGGESSVGPGGPEARGMRYFNVYSCTLGECCCNASGYVGGRGVF